MAYMGYRVDSGLMDENAMLPFAVIFIAVILTSVIAAVRYMNTKARK